MTVTLYKCSCSDNTVDKLSSLASQTQAVTCSAYEPIDDRHGYLILDSAYDDYNYVKISNIAGIDRYYFTRNRELMPAKRCKILLEEDVLMTFKDKILNTECLIKQSTADGNSYINSGYPVKSFSRIYEDCSPELRYSDNNDNTYFTLMYCGSSKSIADSGINKINNESSIGSALTKLFGG